MFSPDREHGRGPLAYLKRRELAFVNWLWPRIDDPDTAEHHLGIVRWAVVLAALLQLVPFITARDFPEVLHTELVLNPRTLPLIVFYGTVYAIGYRYWPAMAAALVLFVLDSLVVARFGWEGGPFAQVTRDYGPIELIVALYVIRCFTVGVRAARVRARFAQWRGMWRDDQE